MNTESTDDEQPRRFYLDRHLDESGMSGTGRVAEGVELPNGACVMWWLQPPHSVQLYRSMTDLEHIHGHGEKETTSVVYVDADPGQAEAARLIQALADIRNRSIIWKRGNAKDVIREIRDIASRALRGGRP